MNTETRPGRVDLDELAALEEQRDFLLTSLEDLDREHAAGDLDDDDYATLRDDYTVRAARVIEAIEHRQELIDATEPTHRGWRRVLAVAAVAVVAVVAGLVVTSTSGSTRSTAAEDGTLEAADQTQRCIEQMGRTFGDAEDGSDFATSAVATLECFTERLDAEPDDAVALTYRGRTEALLAQQLEGVAAEADVERFAQRARTDLERALELEPEYADALAFSALFALQQGDRAAAEDYVARIDAMQLPGNHPVLPMVNNAIRPALRAPTTTTPATEPAAPGSTPPSASTAPPGPDNPPAPGS